MARRSTTARRSPTARRSGIRWDRVSRFALLAVLLVIVLLYVSPTKHWLEQSATAGRQRDELRDLARENRELKRRARELRRPATLEREARRLGMVRKGERAFVIENLAR